MYYFFSVFAGVMIAVMIVLNGGLSDLYGVYASTLIIHLVGLAVAFGAMLVKRDPLRPASRPAFRYYLGGAIGAATTLFNNMAFGYISISAILALTLLGQSITSFFIDAFGLLEMGKHHFDRRKLFGLLLITAGIALMIVL